MESNHEEITDKDNKLQPERTAGAVEFHRGGDLRNTGIINFFLNISEINSHYLVTRILKRSCKIINKLIFAELSVLKIECRD